MLLIHPDLILHQALDRQRELIAEADQYRLLAIARRWRRPGRARDGGTLGDPTVVEDETNDTAAGRGAADVATTAREKREVTAVGRGLPAGTLAPCGGRAGAPVR